MRKSLLLVLLVAVLASMLATAQESTPSPSGDNARVQGPLSVIDNLHAAVPPFTSVITNPTLSGETLPILVNGRVIEVPPGWSYTGQPGVGGLPPYIARYEGQGVRFGMDYISGQAGFAQDGIQLYGNQRYVVRIQYRSELAYSQTNVPFTPSHVRALARLYTAQGGFTDLPAQAWQGTETAHTVEWVIESTANPYPFVRLEALLSFEWPIFTGAIYLEAVDILTAPADYRPQFVIHFE